MLAVYCRDEIYRGKLERALARGREAHILGDWRLFERTATRAECSVVVIPWLAGDAALKHLALFKSLHALHPVVLVTRGDIENARALKDVIVDEVVWTQEMERELADAVGRTCVLSQTRSLATQLRGAPHVPTRLREALARACESERPIRTVEKLASAVGCDRRTLWAEWKQTLGEDASELRLQDFLHWLVLLRAAGRKTASRPWAEVAGDVGVHPHTLGRMAQQLAGAPLRDLSAGGQAALATRFENQVMGTLLGEGGDKPGPNGRTSVDAAARAA